MRRNLGLKTLFMRAIMELNALKQEVRRWHAGAMRVEEAAHHAQRAAAEITALYAARPLGWLPSLAPGPRLTDPAFAAAVLNCVEIKILRRVRAESPRRPPRHRRDACSMAWRCRFLTARPSQDGRVHPTHWLIYAQVVAVLDVGVKLAHDVLRDHSYEQPDDDLRRRAIVNENQQSREREAPQTLEDDK